MKKYECLIEVTSDWATIEFKGAKLSKTNIVVLDGKLKSTIDGNKVFLALTRLKHGVFKSRSGGTILSDYFSRMKFSFAIRKNKQIESILLEKGDAGEINIEIDGNHFSNSFNDPNNSRNPIEVFLPQRIEKEVPKVPEVPKVTEVIEVPEVIELSEEKPKPKYPSVLILTPTKNDAHYLPKYFKAWEKVDYPREKIRWVWIYGESKDKTMKKLDKYFSKRKWNCEIYSEPEFKNLIPNTALWIADILNHFKDLYRGEDYVLMSDTDLSYLPPDLLQKLIEVDKDVVAPYVWQEFDHRVFFDTYIFRYDGDRRFNGNPPFKNSSEPVKMESVGTIFLIKGEVFLKANWENPAPHLQFCKNVRRLGYEVWALPYVGVRHADVRNESHPPVEDYKRVLSKYMLNKMRSTI